MTTLSFQSGTDLRRWDTLRMHRGSKRQVIVKVEWGYRQMICTVEPISDYRFIRFFQVLWYKIKYRK